MELSQAAAEAILGSFESYQARFTHITHRAQVRFEKLDGQGAQNDAVERLELYKTVMGETVASLHSILQDQVRDGHTWSAMKEHYERTIAWRADIELAKTFFNSSTRRVFDTVGVNEEIEFTGASLQKAPPEPNPPIFRTHPYQGSSSELLTAILRNYPFENGYQDLPRDADLMAEELEVHLKGRWGAAPYDRVEVIKSVFYRSNMAFLVGRVCRMPEEATAVALQEGEPHTWKPAELRKQYTPFVICLVNTPEGVAVDALLLDEDAVSIVFSFTRSYFHVEVQRPIEFIRFLKSILPLKRIAELYISLGYNKHGKTELFRELMMHMDDSNDSFQLARGQKGLVMSVFTLPSLDMVFKVIRDSIQPPKSTTRSEVMGRYDLVFRHDRAGRLVDAQEFEHLEFEKGRFSPELLDELMKTAPTMVRFKGACVAIEHLYSERRLTPLDLYIRESSLDEARSAVLDYGQAIKDLAATNVFPGDVLLKNFGVTRHGRVVFYDYDELGLLSEINFRKMPPPRNHHEEFSDEPFFYVGPKDVFPEEFRTFLGLQEPLRSTFLDVHGDLFQVGYWREMQKRHEAGEIIPVKPYPETARLKRK